MMVSKPLTILCFSIFPLFLYFYYSLFLYFFIDDDACCIHGDGWSPWRTTFSNQPTIKVILTVNVMVLLLPFQVSTVKSSGKMRPENSWCLRVMSAVQCVVWYCSYCNGNSWEIFAGESLNIRWISRSSQFFHNNKHHRETCVMESSS